MISQSSNIQQLRPASGIIATDLRKVNKGALVAFCTLNIPAWHLTLNDCKWFKTNKGEWIGLPSSSFTARDGAVRYKNLVEFSDKEASARFQEAALAAVRKLA